MPWTALVPTIVTHDATTTTVFIIDTMKKITISTATTRRIGVAVDAVAVITIDASDI